MKIIKIRDLEGNWNEKFYGKDKNEIYLNEEKIALTEEEVKEVTKQAYNKPAQDNSGYVYRTTKEEQIISYIEELAKMTEDKEELLERFKEIANNMQSILKNK